MFFCGAVAGTKIERVVCIHAVSGCFESALQRDRIEYGEQLIFAMEAAIGGVGAIRWIFQFVCFHEFVMDIVCANEIFNDVAVVRGVTWRERGDRESAGAESFLSGPGEVCGVGAAGESDDDRRQSR
jgi:hypothetical protein